MTPTVSLKAIEFNTHAERQGTSRSAGKLYTSASNIKDLVTQCGEAGCLLYQYYLSKAGIDNFQYTDEKSAKYFGWKESKAKKVRQKLDKANWHYQVAGSHNNGTKTVTTYLGQDKVREAKDIPNIWSMSLNEASKYGLTTVELSELVQLAIVSNPTTKKEAITLIDSVKAMRGITPLV